MAPAPSHSTTCWWCGSTVRRPFYGVRFFSYAFQKYRVRDICARCWYDNTAQRLKAKVAS